MSTASEPQQHSDGFEAQPEQGSTRPPRDAVLPGKPATRAAGIGAAAATVGVLPGALANFALPDQGIDPFWGALPRVFQLLPGGPWGSVLALGMLAISGLLAATLFRRFWPTASSPSIAPARRRVAAWLGGLQVAFAVQSCIAIATLDLGEGYPPPVGDAASALLGYLLWIGLGQALFWLRTSPSAARRKAGLAISAAPQAWWLLAWLSALGAVAPGLGTWGLAVTVLVGYTPPLFLGVILGGLGLRHAGTWKTWLVGGASLWAAGSLMYSASLATLALMWAPSVGIVGFVVTAKLFISALVTEPIGPLMALSGFVIALVIAGLLALFAPRRSTATTSAG